MKKILVLLLTICLSFSLLVGCGGKEDTSPSKDKSEATEPKSPEDYKGEITVWSFTNEPEYIIEKFNKKYPNVKVNFTHISGGSNYISKINSALSAKTGVPDVFTAEVSFLKNWVNAGVWENLNEEPYNGKELTKDILPYVMQLGSDNDSNIRALAIQATPGGVFYRRGLAKQYLGTDDPEEVNKAMSNLDDYIALGKKLRDESDGKVKLIAHWKDLRWYPFNARTKPWVENNKLNIEPVVLDYFDLAKTVREENITAKSDPSDPSWYAGMADGTTFSYILPTWGLHFELKPGAEPDVEDPSNYSGDWAVTYGPQAYYWGGTWMGMYKDSPNKELAWEFIKYYASDEDYIKTYVEEKGDFICNTKIAEELSKDMSEPFLGGQNHYKFFLDQAKDIDASKVTKYDNNIEKLLLNAISLYVDNGYSKDDAVNEFKKEVKNAYPEIEVE